MEIRETLLKEIQSRFPKAQENVPKDPKWVVGPELQVSLPVADVAEAASALRKDLGFDLLEFITAVDWIKENQFEMVYFFTSSSDPRKKVFLKALLPREGSPRVPSVAASWEAADWQEREIYDLYGIHFDGHPNLKRILLWEGYAGYPLRKDYVHIADKYDNGEEIGIKK